MKAFVLPLLLLAASCTAVGGDPATWSTFEGQRVFARARSGERWLLVGGQPARGGWLADVAGDGGSQVLHHLGDDVGYCVDVDAAERRVAIGMADGRLLLADTGNLTERAVRWQHARPIVAVAFSPDGAFLASASRDGTVRVGSPATHEPPVVLEHTAAATCLSWSSDGATLVSGAVDGKVRMHTADGRLLRSWNRLGGEVVRLRWRDGITLADVVDSSIAAPRTVLLPR